MIKTYKLINSIINLAIIIASSTKLVQKIGTNSFLIHNTILKKMFLFWMASLHPYSHTDPHHSIAWSKMPISISDKILH